MKTFDPSQPFEVIDGPTFDASAPFEIVPDDAGFFSGTAGSVRRGVKQAQQQINALGAVNRSDWQRRQLEEADRLEAQADAIDELQPNWSSENRAAWAQRARATAKTYRERAATQPEIIVSNLKRIGELQSEIEGIPQSRGKREFDEAAGLGESLAALARHPIDVTAGVASESIPASVPSLALGAVGSVGGPVGTATGAGIGSLVMEYGGTLLDSLQSAGYDLNRPETLAPLLNDPQRMAELRAHAIRRGVPVAVFDALSAGIAGRLLRTPAKTLLGKAGQGVAEIGIQGALGGAGEVAGSVAAGDKIDPKAVLAEILGEVGSGTVEAATGHARDRVFGKTESRRDTGQNIPESPATLEAQQEQLRAGRRKAQMFPTGTPELPLPNGMKRLETERGVFHYNPRLIGEDELWSATKKGRENDVLALGSQSKEEVEQRAAAGEQRVAVTERTPEGIEVKTAVATDQTAPRTLAELNRAKTPGNVVAVEPIERIPAERAAEAKSNLVQDLLARQAQEMEAQREAQARELIERDKRQRELAEKRTRFDERIAMARDVMGREDATFTEVNGALESVRFYAEDNSLGLSQDQREAAHRAASTLARRLDFMKAAEMAQREAEQQPRAELARAENALRAEQRRMETAKLQAEAAAGIGASGRFEYDSAPMAALEQRAAQGDQRAIDTIVRRSDQANAEPLHGESLLDVLEKIKLPASDEALGAELKLLQQEMNGAQAARFFSRRRRMTLDRTAEALRERGFADIKTPSDVLDFTQRALRGEKIFARSQGETEFATARDQQLAGEWRAVANDRQAFQWPNSRALGANDIARDMSLPGYALRAETRPTGSIYFFSEKGGDIAIIRDAETGAFNINSLHSQGEAGGPRSGGAQLYQAAMTWIRNNGHTVDPSEKVTPINQLRRTSAMLSSALRHDTTDHISPHADQRVPWEGGDRDANIAALARREAELVSERLPQTRGWSIDPTNGNILDAAGRRVAQRDVERALRANGGPGEHGIGIATLRRTLLTRGLDAEQPGFAARLRKNLGTGEGPQRGVLYAQGRRAADGAGEGVAEHGEFAPATDAGDVSGTAGPADLRSESGERAEVSPQATPEALAGRIRRGLEPTREIDLGNGWKARYFASEAAREQSAPRSMEQIESAIRRGGIERDRAARAVNAFIDGQPPTAWDERGRVKNTALTEAQARALAQAVQAYDSGNKFTFPPGMRDLVMVNYARGRMEPRFTEIEIEREVAAIRKAFPQLVRENDVQVGNVQRALRDRGYRGEVPPEVQAAIMRTRGERSLIVLSERAYRDRAKGSALITHELAHPFWDTLPAETRAELEALHAREVREKTGPLYRDGQLQTELDFVEDLDMRGHKEWFAERIARLNEAWAKGEIDAAEANVLKRAAYRLREFIRKVWATIARGEGIDPEGALFVEEFRKFFLAGGDTVIARQAGEAYARAVTPEFASTQGLLELGGGVGLRLPPTVRNLQPRWQSKVLEFESSLDRALYYAGGEGNTEVRSSVVRSLAEQTGLSEARIASLARDLRTKLAPIAGSAASEGTVRVPELMRESVAKETGVEFAAEKREREPSAPEDIEKAKARYTQLREDFDRATSDAERLRREMEPLWESQEPDAENRLRALQAELQDNERATRAMYSQIAALRQRLDEANPVKAELPAGKTAQQVIAEAARVEALPKVDRKAALLAEWRYGKEMRDKALKVGNESAADEGQRLVNRAKARLDDEFPGWEKDAYAKPTHGADRPPPTKPPPAEPGSADESDREQSPFAEPEKDMPVRVGKADEVFAHSSYKPSFLERSWEKVRDVIRSIKGSVPELPTFGGAAWNKSDSFIREHGPNFYDGIKAFYRKLVSANDGIQRQAEEDVARITKPLIEAGGGFDANDWAKLKRLQEQDRRSAAAGEAPNERRRQTINALQRKMESAPYVLFNRLVYFLDANWRYQNLKDNRGNPITQPGGLNGAEIQSELQRLGERIAASDHENVIRKALDEHMALVKRVADDLKQRDLMAIDALQNPFYFPHVVLEVRRGANVEERDIRPARVKPGTEVDFRGYLQDPVGSTKRIESDYVNAMYYHLVEVGVHNAKADAIRDFARPYDIKSQVEATAKQLSKQRGTPVSWQAAFNEEYAPRGYVLYGTDSRDAFPSITVDRDKLAQRLGVMLTSEDLQRQFDQLGLKGVKLLPEDLRETLQHDARETWIVPARVAEALRGIAERQSRKDNAIEGAMKWTQGAWKAWKLFMPQSHTRYEYGNIVGDLEKLVSATPQTFKYFPQAIKEVRGFWLGGEPTKDLRAAVREGVINTVTAQDMHALHRLPNFRAFETSDQRLVAELKGAVSAPLANLSRLTPRFVSDVAGGDKTRVGRLFKTLSEHGLIGRTNSVEESAFREAVFRYANYLSNLKTLREGSRPAYAGAYARDIDAMQDSRPGAGDANVRKAAAISKATFGDYGDISVAGHWLRDKLIPFYSWTEVNFKYQANLLRNLRDMVRAGETSQAEAMKAGARAAAVFAAGFTARAAGGVALRLILPYVAAYMWNNSGDREELEDQLSEEDRRRFHIILGKTDDGRVQVMYGNTAFMDVMKYFSGAKFVQAMSGWVNGRTDFPTAISQWRDQIVPDALNNTVGQAVPKFKLPYTVLRKKNPFPDVTDQHTVPEYDMRRLILGQASDDFTADIIERLVNKDYYASKDVGDWAKQLILQVRQRDPEQWAFYAIKDKAEDFLAKQTGQKRGGSYDAPDQQVLRNFRRALYRGDVENATRFYQRLLEYGYTAERFAASIRAQDPMSELPKELRRPFLESLTPLDREMLDRAYAYYSHITASKGHEAQFFPRKASGAAGLERYRNAPRTELLQQQMERIGELTEDDELSRAERVIRESLRRR